MLARATKGGDAACSRELGLRLLVGDRAPVRSSDGLRFIGFAAHRGDAAAMARIAAFMAGGTGIPQDWTGALTQLATAAEAGDEDARQQLICLQPEGAAPADWLRMAHRVPLDAWLAPAATEPLHPSVHRVHALAPPRVCRWLMSRARGRLRPARVYDAVSRREQVHEMRTNSSANFTLADIDVVQFLVQARMAASCGFPLRHCEAPMVLHYRTGQQITPHFDFIDAQAADYEQQIREQGQRMVTFLLYLNDDYEGGETTFPELGLVNRGSAGDGLYFVNAHADATPDRRMLHTGSPPTKGEKWIVSQFVRNIRLRD